MSILLENLKKYNVGMITGAAVTGISENSVSYKKDGADHTIAHVDNVVIAVGVKSHDDLSGKLEGIVENVIVLGDARNIGKAIDAIHEGYAAGLAI
jgi:NADH dehydrogenase FAD-containing subunit